MLAREDAAKGNVVSVRSVMSLRAVRSATFFQVPGNVSQRGRALRVAAKGCVTAFAAAIAVIACGSQRPPPAGDSTYTPSSASAWRRLRQRRRQQQAPRLRNEGRRLVCDCIDTPLFTDPPNMYFVLDRSGSMQPRTQVGRGSARRLADPPRPRPAREFRRDVVPGLQHRSVLGAERDAADQPRRCARRRRRADHQAACSAPRALRRAAERRLPRRCASCFRSSRRRRARRSSSSPPTAVRTATRASRATPRQCQPNIEGVAELRRPAVRTAASRRTAAYESCLDSAATRERSERPEGGRHPRLRHRSARKRQPAYASLLDQLASAGGTALPTSPKYYNVDLSNSAVLLAALKKIAAQIVATCEFKLTMAPAQADRVNVYFDEVVVPARSANGWKIEGQTVTLLGDSCKKVLAGDVLDVRIITGCPTVEPR